MFVFLSKFLPPLIYPLGLAMLLIVLALVLRRRPRLRTGIEIAALALLLVTSNQLFASWLARSLEWQYLPPAEIPHTDVIVLLGGGTEPQQPPRDFPELNGAGDRLLHAAQLYQQGKAPAILASGGNITWLENRATTPASDMAEILQLMGVPAGAIWQENQSQNTYENALFCARILKEKGITRVILVTSAMHMPRSVALFRKQGIEVIPSPADFSITTQGWQEMSSTPGAWAVHLLPEAGSLSTISAVLKEYIGMFVYHLRGWM